MMGTHVVRREDPALIQGRARYVANLSEDGLDGALVVTFVRSPMAHAVVESIDVVRRGRHAGRAWRCSPPPTST